jgi:hypothetical protein
MYEQQVKIFMGFGKDGVNNLEKEINAWLASGGPVREIVSTQTAVCQVADNPAGERDQCLVVTVWYRAN